MVLCAARGLLSHFNPASKDANATTTTTKQPLDSSFLFFTFCIFLPTLGTLADRSKRKIAFTAENSVGKSLFGKNINRLVIVETTGWAFPLCNFCGLTFLLTNFLHRKQVFPIESIKLRFPPKRVNILVTVVGQLVMRKNIGQTQSIPV